MLNVSFFKFCGVIRPGCNQRHSTISFWQKNACMEKHYKLWLTLATLASDRPRLLYDFIALMTKNILDTRKKSQMDLVQHEGD